MQQKVTIEIYKRQQKVTKGKNNQQSKIKNKININTQKKSKVKVKASLPQGY